VILSCLPFGSYDTAKRHRGQGPGAAITQQYGKSLLADEIENGNFRRTVESKLRDAPFITEPAIHIEPHRALTAQTGFAPDPVAFDPD